MAKSLRDIIGPRAGRQLPKPEEEFLDKHTVDVKEYPVKQKKEAVPHKDTSIDTDDHKKSPQNEEEVLERTMTSSEKKKESELKDKYDGSGMKKSMQKQYGKEEGKKVYFATIRKKAMNRLSGSPDTKSTYPDVTADNNAGARI